MPTPVGAPQSESSAEFARAQTEFLPKPGAGSFKCSLGPIPSHELVKELDGPWRTGDLKRNRAAVGLGRHGEPKKATATPLGVNHLPNLGK